MWASAGSANGLKAGSQPTGTRLSGTTDSIDVELWDGRSTEDGDSRSPLLTRLTQTEPSLLVIAVVVSLTPPVKGPSIATAAMAAATMNVTPAIRDISLFICHPRSNCLLLH